MDVTIAQVSEKIPCRQSIQVLELQPVSIKYAIALSKSLYEPHKDFSRIFFQIRLFRNSPLGASLEVGRPEKVIEKIFIHIH